MTATQPKTRSFGIVKSIVFSAILFVLFFGVAEIAVRAWVYLFRAPAERFDLTTGTFILVPGEYPRVGAPPIRVNSRGFVGPEFDEPRAAGTVRIVSLGDSCTFGQGAGVETYPAQLAMRLNNGNDTRRYQVINAGIEGLNSQLALRRLVTKVVPLKPDIITVYLGWNDLMKFDPAGQVERPGLAIVARTLDSLWLTKGMRKLLFYYIRPRLTAPATGPASRTGAFIDYRPAVFETNLRSIVRTSRYAGATALLVTLPSVVSDDMTLDDIRRSNIIFPYYSSAYGVRDYVDLIAAYNKAIRGVAESEGAPLVDLAKEIDGRPDRRQLFFDTMHPNQRGRELIGEILARRLREARLLGS